MKVKRKYNYTTKNLFIFPLLAIVLLFIAFLVLFYADNMHMKYLMKDSDISWALNNPRPEVFQSDSFSRDTEIFIKWRKEEIAKWDALHADIPAAKKDASDFFIKSVTSGIAGIFVALFACWFIYKTCRFSIPVATKAMKRVIDQSTTTSIRRLGVLFLAVACILLACGIVSWNTYRNARLFDVDYFHGILSFFGVAFFLVGVALSSGMAERLAKWIKHGN